MKLYLTLGIWCLLLLGCSNDESNFVQLSYVETQCSDAWGNAVDTEIIKAYLAEKGIRTEIIYREYVLPDDTAICMACTCGNGWILYVSVHQDDVDKAIDLGFVKN